MAKNVALFGRRELQAHRRIVEGVTASVPLYKDADQDGNKEWVVDVYTGPIEGPDQSILRNVPIAPYAKQLVTAIRQPVSMERSKQGKYTVVGRSKVMTAGAQTEDGSIFDPTYNLVQHNFANLGLRFIADIDYTLEELQETPTTKLQENPTDPLQVINGSDAFGYPVVGPNATNPPPSTEIEPTEQTTTRHIRIVMSKLGPKGDPLAMDWGVSQLQFPIQEIVEATY